MKNNSLSVARPAIFSISVFGKNAYNTLFLNILTLSLKSGRAANQRNTALLSSNW